MKPSLSIPSTIIPDLKIPLKNQRKASLKRLEKALEYIYKKYDREFRDSEEIDLLTGEIFVQGKGNLTKNPRSSIPFGSLTSYLDNMPYTSKNTLQKYPMDYDVDEFILDSFAPVLNNSFASKKFSSLKRKRYLSSSTSASTSYAFALPTRILPLFAFNSNLLPLDELAVPLIDELAVPLMDELAVS
ncbi:hypothetical protein HMI54_011702 [Coelomomyces lativittatus]|nr:hypothetical protein HMI56_005841 [Coelomomyces lativittatus]KAJ1499502.1 hypothetical protein HMI54_011702 [Coelomomyces lativittatus]KAJ1517891.1 hypothetical protein HMI55_005111 [Coelomomyces lativittatus]